MDERLIASVGIRCLLMAAAIYNLRRAYHDRRLYRDARGLRGFVAAITMLAGVLSLTTGSQLIAAYFGAPSLFAVVTGMAVMVFLAGLIFSCVSWGRK